MAGALGPHIDWDLTTSNWMTSPYWTKQEQKDFELCKVEAPTLSGHIWIKSSGSTSKRSRWYALAKQAFLSSAEGVNAHLKVTDQDVWVKCLPDFHVGGLSIYARKHLAGFSVIELKKWSAHSFIDIIKSNRSTLCSLVPTQIYDLLKTGEDFTGLLRAVVVGGDALSEDLYLRAKEKGLPLLPSYGSTETCSQIATASLASLEQNNYPLMKFLDHVEVTQTSRGTLKVYSDCLYTGVLIQLEDGDVTWQQRKEPFYLTQDLVEMERGKLVTVHRPESRLKVSGELVSLDQLKSRLASVAYELNEDLVRFELLALPDERRGQQVVLVTTAEITNAQALLRQFNDKSNGIERIHKIYKIPRIPRSAIGKLQQNELRKLLGYAK